MHCGFIPRSQWTGGPEALPPSFAGEPYTADVCPGWLVNHHPDVAYGAEAYAALEAGALYLFDPQGLNITWELAMLAKRAFNLYESQPRPGALR